MAGGSLAEEAGQHVFGGRNLEAAERNQDIHTLGVKVVLGGLKRPAP
jgi:hypothetical protein